MSRRERWPQLAAAFILGGALLLVAHKFAPRSGDQLQAGGNKNVTIKTNHRAPYEYVQSPTELDLVFDLLGFDRNLEAQGCDVLGPDKFFDRLEQRFQGQGYHRLPFGNAAPAMSKNGDRKFYWIDKSGPVRQFGTLGPVRNSVDLTVGTGAAVCGTVWKNYRYTLGAKRTSDLRATMTRANGYESIPLPADARLLFRLPVPGGQVVAYSIPRRPEALKIWYKGAMRAPWQFSDGQEFQRARSFQSMMRFVSANQYCLIWLHAEAAKSGTTVLIESGVL